MKGSYHQQEQVIAVPKTSFAAKMAPLLLEDAPQRYIPTPAHKSLMLKQTDRFAHGIREHVKLGSKITDTLKGKLTLGARILQLGGVRKVFRQLFSVSEGERLLKASQCYLSTSAGPIAGLLFISTHKLAFCSERSIQLSSPEGKKSIRVHYKVLIPLEKIEMANQSENVKNPSQKYMEIVTLDGFDFWFMGFLSYKKAFKCLQQAISSSRASTTS
ncbi:GEM-like protein 4 [Linum grandiflorum]